jgi:hypothetical protein
LKYQQQRGQTCDFQGMRKKRMGKKSIGDK